MNNYGIRTTTMTRGEGAFLWDNKGRRYLDALSGIAVCVLGHSHPSVAEVLCKQAHTLIHCSNLFLIPPQQELGAKLTQVAEMDKVIFSNSGAEANEAAIKIARKLGHNCGIEQAHIISAKNSFHGRTMATLTATGNEKVKQGFTPLLEGFTQVEYNSIEAIEAAAQSNTVAVMLEPIQGEGGVVVPSPDYLKKVRALCDQHNWLMILDEIQTGNGRTGTYFNYQRSGVLPDIVTTAKGLGNGLPIGACLARGEAAEVFQPGSHGSTFGGNPLVCAAALKVLEILCEGKLMTQAAALGDAIRNQFVERIGSHPRVVDVRGCGMMIGIELDKPCAELVEKAKERGLIINVTASNTIRLLPPLILDSEQAQEIIDGVCALIEQF